MKAYAKVDIHTAGRLRLQPESWDKEKINDRHHEETNLK